MVLPFLSPALIISVALSYDDVRETVLTCIGNHYTTILHYCIYRIFMKRAPLVRNSVYVLLEVR